ncbi:polysaccharide lyase family 7 protein [Thalassotalea euphylliae]|uniref:polysaccharide lyase family 7 protein n=1 Tax=Thalassotalea euphylliae TaxID=1655234 RepID=UPI003636F737
MGLILVGCGSSAGGNSPATDNIGSPTQPGDSQTPTTPPIDIADISCDVSYKLELSDAYSTGEDTSPSESIAELIDQDKTHNSSWTAPLIDNSLVIKLAAPALVKEAVLTWGDNQVSHHFSVFASKDNENWQLLVNQEQSQVNALIPDVTELTSLTSATAKYIRFDLTGTSLSQPSELLEVEVFGCEQNVSHDIELVDWYLSVPTDEDSNGRSDSIKEQDLAAGYFDPRFFMLSKDGGITFSTSVSGYKTSTNTNYVRSELREMLRRGNTNFSTQGVNQNNWVFSSAPLSDQNNAGGIDGEMLAELAVNHVTTTGEGYQIGRVIIGQIHANDDEPVRLYYRKLPDNVNGAIYIAHELLGGEDTYYELIGSRGNSASNPPDGIPLNERFSYRISVDANVLTVAITKADGSEVSEQVDMSASGYDQGGQYMYFKAGTYNQNNSGDRHDYVQATFYRIENSHDGYSPTN